MSGERSVYLLTTNAHKLKEYNHNFERYGIKVYSKNPAEFDTNDKKFAILKNIKTNNGVVTGVLAMLEDQTELYKSGTKERATLSNLELVDQTTVLTVHSLNETKDGVAQKVYTNTQEGFIDLSRQQPRLLRGEVFGWDDTFVNKHTGKTHLESRKTSVKVSSRDGAIAQYIKERYYYRKRNDLKFSPQNTSKVTRKKTN